MFQDALESTKEEASEGSSSTTFAYVAIHYARFVQHVKKDIEKARSIYEDALGIAPHQRILWDSYVLLETYAKQEKEGGLNTKVSSIFKRALATESMSAEDKEQLSLHSLEYTDLLGSRDELTTVQSTHWKVFRGSAQASEEGKDGASNKRALETDLTSAPKRMIPAPPPNAHGASAVPMPNQQHYQHHPSYQHQAQQDYYGNGQANYDYSQQQQQQAYSNYYQTGYYQQQQ